MEREGRGRWSVVSVGREGGRERERERERGRDRERERERERGREGEREGGREGDLIIFKPSIIIPLQYVVIIHSSLYRRS